MNSVYNLDIESISTILHKKEIGDFVFANKHRYWDGFVFFTEGHGVFIDPKGERRTFNEGTLLLLKKGDSYEIHSIGSCSYVTSGFFFTPTSMELIDKLPTVIRCNDKQSKQLNEICSIWQSHTWDSYTLCRIKLLSLFIDLFRSCQDIDGETDNDIHIAKQYIHENFGKKFSFEELTLLLALSPSYLRSKFKKYTGCTISSYRENLRISCAKEMLESGLFSLKETANRLGYCDSYHFSKAFKAAVGISPGHFVRENSSGKN